MTTQFFKKSLFARVIAFIIIVNFVLTSGPIGSVFASDSLRRPAATESKASTPQEITDALRQQVLGGRITVWFEELRKGDVPFVGGKNANLGELRNFLGDMIPNGFAVTVKGFQDHLNNNFVEYKGGRMTLGDYIYARTKDLDYANDKARSDAAYEIREAIINAVMPKEVEAQIREDYAKLCEEAGEKDVDVAVRSSATAEDLPEASFAGQQITLLNMRGINNVLEATKKCWASLYEQRAMAYRHNQNIAENKAFLSVAIQLMVKDEKAAGVMFTVDVENGSPGITINSNYGLGESVVGGEIEPDQDKLVYDVKTGKPTSWQRHRGTKLAKTIRTAEGTQSVETALEERGSYCLTVEQIEKLGEAGQVIHRHYGRVMDVEWVVNTKGRLKIVQARPDTAWSDDPLVQKSEYMQVPETVAVEAKQKARVVGRPGSPRAGIGPVKIIKSEPVIDPKTGKENKKATSEALTRELEKVQEGDTLVAKMTSPDYFEAMKRAAAVVTDEGGLTCHAAIVTRELGKPGTVGTGNATKLLQDGQVVTTDSKIGYVAEEALPLVKVTQLNDFRTYPKLRTLVGLVISDPDLAALLWKFGNYVSYGGIGLVRDEQFLLTQILKHPQAVIDYDNYYDPNYTPKEWQHDKQWIKEHVIDIDGEAIQKLIKDYPSFKAFYVDIKKNGLVKIAKAQAGGQRVLYRTSDFKSNEFRNLKLGTEYEPDEANPMAGNRGLRRVLTPEFNEVFRLDLQAVKEARKLRSNIDVMFPVVRTPEDISAGVQIMAEEGLFDGEDKPKIAIMVELASNVLMVEEMYKTLADLAKKYGTKAKMSIGSNDLTQFILGVDRDSGKMAKYANFWDPAVMKAIEILIKTAKRYDIETGICGEAPSKDAKFCRFLVGCGIDTISLAPESYDAGVKVIEEAEKELEGKPFDPTIKDWEYPSQLEIKQLPRIVAEKVDASTIIQGLGVHPQVFMKEGRHLGDFLLSYDTGKAEDAVLIRNMSNKLAGGTAKEFVIDSVSDAILAKAQVTDAATPIIFTTDSNQSTQYKKMIAGEHFEADDENPYLAFCGLVRVVDPEWEDFFRWQLQGVKKARELSGRNNIGIRLDLAITTESVRRALEIMKEEGLVPGQDGLLVGMEIDRGGHFVILNQYLDLGLNFISENPQRFLDYVLPEDPGNPYVNIPLDRKQRQLINGQKIWTNIAARIAARRGVPVPLVQFEGEAIIAPTPTVSPVPTITPPAVTPAFGVGTVLLTKNDEIRGQSPTHYDMGFPDTSGDVARIVNQAKAINANKAAQTAVYNNNSTSFGNWMNAAKASQASKGAVVVVGANAIFDNADSIPTLKMLKGTQYQVVVWAQNEAELTALKAMGVEEITETLISQESTHESLEDMAIRFGKSGATLLVTSPLDRQGINLVKVQEAGVQVANLEKPDAAEKGQINSMPLVIARGITGILQTDEAVVKQFKELTQNYSGKISEEKMAALNNLNSVVFDMPLVQLTEEKDKEVLEAQISYEETVGEI